MHTRVALVYNEPQPDSLTPMGEVVAIMGVLEAVEAVGKSLRELDYEVIPVPLVPPADGIKAKLEATRADLVFNLFEGFDHWSEAEALVPETCEALGIPYTGCPGSAIRLGLDKARAKALLRSNGIRTPDYQMLTYETVSEFRLTYPCIVKPKAEDASHGLSETSVVYNDEALARQVKTMIDLYGGDALVEQYIDGREFNASVLGNEELTILPVSEIVFELPENLPRVLTFEAKWKEDTIYFTGTKAVCPAHITPAQKRVISQTVLKTYRLFGCCGYARADMRMDWNGRIYIIEVNPNPDIAPDTGAARQAEASGMSYTEFIDRIARLALKEKSWVHSPSVL